MALSENIIVPIIITIIGSSGFWTLITHLITSKKEKKSGERAMILGLGHDKIRYLCQKYIERGYITTDEFDNLYTYLYLPYKALGGNGTGEKLMNAVMKLPLKTE